jgi:hypothetical protein
MLGGGVSERNREVHAYLISLPSFRIALETEEEERKPFRNALDKSDRKKFDEMFDIPSLYISACSNSVQLKTPSNSYVYLLSSLQRAN